MSDEQPPRRNSVGECQRTPGLWAIAQRTAIFLDGVIQRDVLEYDCDTGTLTRNVLDADGKPVLTPERDAILTETVTGDVTVRWKEPA